MPAAVETSPSPATGAGAKISWPGVVISGLAALFMAFDGIVKLVPIAPVLEASAKLGIPAGLARTIGVLDLACLLLYVIPRTAPLGAVLLTGYLGGAVAIHVRVGDPLFSHVLFPVYVGVMLWLGLWLRDARVRAMIR